ncbi:MAG: 50S ribosomal protein L17 [Candidatus Cloacimonadota bacterium]|nr:50S ribosomal protein L17 [Candidatus Cloacimonadota bacterium]
MKHRKNGTTTFGKRKAHRKSMLYNMAAQLIIHNRIETTHRRAKEVQKISDRLITVGKNDSIHSRRQAFKILTNRDLVKKLFDDIAPKYKNRNGGYTRVIKIGHRRGDAAPISILEYVEEAEKN